MRMIPKIWIRDNWGYLWEWFHKYESGISEDIYESDFPKYETGISEDVYENDSQNMNQG